MRLISIVSGFAILSTLLTACANDPAEQIPVLEQYYITAGEQSTADSLLVLYHAAMEAHPDKQAENLHYASRAAEIEFVRHKKNVEAVRLLNGALEQYGQGQDLAEPVGVLARIWRNYKYKATPDLSRNPDDIDLMQANLERQMPWIDSALVRLDRQMLKPQADVPGLAKNFIEISDGYSILVEQANPNKHVDLIMRAAKLAKSVGDPNTALRFFYNVAEKKPDHPKAPEALFMMGYIYANDLKDIEKARSTYESFLERYPNDPDYADDAAMEIKFLGMSPEEIIRQFEQNSK
ncbi:MAG: tetratricopeptide repeat protein [Bacteroidetes bacterium]|nr:MAG: tetratricopeptide repeat protein [Bacteroidota bacterium]